MEAEAFAKLNLSLRVRPRDRSGLHPLRSLMQSIDWADSLTLQEADGDAFSVRGLSVPDDESNLAWRALEAVRLAPPDLIVLDRSGKEPRLSLAKGDKNGMQTVKLSPGVRATDIADEAIPAIPSRVIHPFLSQPRVVAQGELDNAPYILGSNAERVVLGAGDDAFATGGKAGVINWSVLRPGKTLKDPETGEVLGYEVEYLGDARTVAEGVLTSCSSKVAMLPVW